jgi:release factor glutamine methyltransferase
MATIGDWLSASTTQLASIGITSAKLDAEIILAHTLRKNRTFLHAHGDDIMSDRDIEIAHARLDLRMDRVPIAYIIGHKEFYGRRFKVTTETLIPRPESEDMIDALKSVMPTNQSLLPETIRVVDVGTGTGCLGITAKLEHPDIDVTLLDISPYALKVAASNATSLNADVRIIKSDLLQNFPFESNIILANLPYVDSSWERSPETDHEPALALFADDNGMSLIKKLIDQSRSTLIIGGHILIEADPEQHADIISYAHGKGLAHTTTFHYCIVLQKT